MKDTILGIEVGGTLVEVIRSIPKTELETLFEALLQREYSRISSAAELEGFLEIKHRVAQLKEFKVFLINLLTNKQK